MISAVNGFRDRIRSALWVALLRARLRRRGTRLVVEGAVRFDGPPRVRVLDRGEGPGRTTLRLARGSSLGRDLELVLWSGGDNVLELREGAYLQRGVRIELRGGTVSLGPHAHVRDSAVLKSQGELTVGREVTISFGDVIACTERVEIGDLCGLGERVTVTDSDHTHDGSDDHYLVQPLRITPVRLGRNVLVSANAVVLRGADVGDNAVIGAGAVVGAGRHDGGQLYLGAPAKPVRRLGA